MTVKCHLNFSTPQFTSGQGQRQRKMAAPRLSAARADRQARLSYTSEASFNCSRRIFLNLFLTIAQFRLFDSVAGLAARSRGCKRCSRFNDVILSALGRRHGVTDLGPEVINYVSHATQQRLRDLLERVSLAAQQKNGNFKVCFQLEQPSQWTHGSPSFRILRFC